MDKKQSAVEWLVNQVNSDCLNSTFIHPKLIEQAKAMEKQQIIDANNIGYSACKRDIDETSEQYYTSTYGQ